MCSSIGAGWLLGRCALCSTCVVPCAHACVPHQLRQCHTSSVAVCAAMIAASSRLLDQVRLTTGKWEPYCTMQHYMQRAVTLLPHCRASGTGKPGTRPICMGSSEASAARERAAAPPGPNTAASLHWGCVSGSQGHAGAPSGIQLHAGSIQHLICCSFCGLRLAVARAVDATDADSWWTTHSMPHAIHI